MMKNYYLYFISNWMKSERGREEKQIGHCLWNSFIEFIELVCGLWLMLKPLNIGLGTLSIKLKWEPRQVWKENEIFICFILKISCHWMHRWFSIFEFSPPIPTARRCVANASEKNKKKSKKKVGKIYWNWFGFEFHKRLSLSLFVFHFSEHVRLTENQIPKRDPKFKWKKKKEI